jgi:U1 small nuclear ribonucleoprotein
VDVERGRTVRNWKPRRLGGGLGSTRVAKAPKRDGGQLSMGTARSVSGDRGGADAYAGDRGGGPAGGPPPYSAGPAPVAGKLQWATERRDDGGPPRGYVGRGDRPRDDRRDERDRGRDRGRDDRDKRDDHSRERRDRDRERDRDRARERGDRDKY